MGWSLPPGKKWSGPPDWAIVDDPDYPEPAPGSQPVPEPVQVAQPPVLDFGGYDDASEQSQRYVAARGRIGNIGATQPDASWNSGGGMDDYGDFGDVGASWGGAAYGSQDPMNLSPNDPASPYYTGAGSGYNQAANYGMQGMEYSMAPGTGMYSVGGGDWQGIQSAPGDSYYYPNEMSMAAGRSMYSDQNPSYRANFNFDLNPEASSPTTGSRGGAPGSRGAPGGGGAPAQQPYQRIALGQPERTIYDQFSSTVRGGPERTLYDRYSQMLQNPERMTQDPAYQFLFNQGMQAFNRTAAGKKMQLAGKTGLDAMQYGQGLGLSNARQMIPLYQQGAGTELNRFIGGANALGQGASQELQRFMGPAGLLPNYAGFNNQVSQMQGADAATAQLLPYYQQMLSGGGGGSYAGGGAESPGTFKPTGASYGGVTPGGQGYDQRLSPEIIQSLMQANYGGPQDIPSLMDEMWG